MGTIAGGEGSNPAGDGHHTHRGEGVKKPRPKTEGQPQNGGAAQALRHTHGRAFLDKAETQGARALIAKTIYFQKR